MAATTSVFDPAVTDALRQMQLVANTGQTKQVPLSDGTVKSVAYPFPSPADWRDQAIYFLLLDRFNNPVNPPAGGAGSWNRKYDFRQGGTFKGVEAQLDYLQQLGIGALWLSPVLKNSRPNWQYNYHGYGIQDFLHVDERFASDGTVATGERELQELVDAAHSRGLYVILDIVLNHTARVFDYERAGGEIDSFADVGVMNGPLGSEPAVQFLNGLGLPRLDWRNGIPSGTALSPDDAIFPTDFQRAEFYRRRGDKLSDNADQSPGGFVRGDFGTMRQLVAEFDARPGSPNALSRRYGSYPVLAILVRIHNYLIARFDVDGFRLDTVKYVAPEIIESFGNAVREYALSVGKRNFFTFGEIYDEEETIARFVGRHNRAGEGFGMDAALDFPLFYQLPQVAKGKLSVESLRAVYRERKAQEETRISSHGEAGRYFVSFLDNHDQHERFHHPQTTDDQVTLGLSLMFTLQGIPCLYYGTEQGLKGTVDSAGHPVLDANESTREALWGHPAGFDTTTPLYQAIQKILSVRQEEAALRYGRIYFREVSGDGVNFGHSFGAGGIVAFSRILAEREVLIVANTQGDSTQPDFSGHVVVDLDQSRSVGQMKLRYSNLGTTGTPRVRIAAGSFDVNGSMNNVPEVASLPVTLKPHEVQIFVGG